MSDPVHAAWTSVPGGLISIAAIREMAVWALVPAEDEHHDDDVVDRLVQALRSLPRVGLVRRAAESPADGQGVRAGARPAQVVADEQAPDLVAERSADGRLVSLTARLTSRSGAAHCLTMEPATEGASLTEEDEMAVGALRDLAALAVALRTARAEARLDPLTGCLNQRAMHAQIDEEIARVERLAGELSCVMLDLDDFKQVNDAHGHPVGDELLRAVASAMREGSRPYDICCRYGGDEFVVILPDADVEDAVRAAERLRAAIARARHRHHGVEVSVVATAGVVRWRPGESRAGLLARADRALMEAKRAGKDEIGRA